MVKKKRLKNFLKPNVLKVLLFIILLTLFSILAGSLFLKYSPPAVTCASLGCHTPSPFQRLVHSESFSLLFILVIIFSYLISCFIIWLINLRFKEKGKND